MANLENSEMENFEDKENNAQQEIQNLDENHEFIFGLEHKEFLEIRRSIFKKHPDIITLLKLKKKAKKYSIYGEFSDFTEEELLERIKKAKKLIAEDIKIFYEDVNLYFENIPVFPKKYAKYDYAVINVIARRVKSRVLLDNSASIRHIAFATNFSIQLIYESLNRLISLNLIEVGTFSNKNFTKFTLVFENLE